MYITLTLHKISENQVAEWTAQKQGFVIELKHSTLYLYEQKFWFSENSTNASKYNKLYCKTVVSTV